MIHLLKAISEANNHLLKENNINDSLAAASTLLCYHIAKTT